MLFRDKPKAHTRWISVHWMSKLANPTKRASAPTAKKGIKKGEKPGCGTGLFPNWGVAWGGGINTRSRGCGTSLLSTPILYGINMNKLWTFCKKMIINQIFLDFCKKEIFFDEEQTNVCNFRTFVLWYKKQTENIPFCFSEGALWNPSIEHKKEFMNI